MRLIDADWLLSYMDLDDMDAFEATETREKIDIKLAIDDAPTVAVPCENCKYKELDAMINLFCVDISR